jgi:meiotically up-regulated gene 157 (Mug157) protein
MVGTHHRPSDDLSTFAFLTPANAMLSVELGHLADILTASGQSKTAQGKNVTEQATLWSKRTHDAIWNTTASCISVSSFIL